MENLPPPPSDSTADLVKCPDCNSEFDVDLADEKGRCMQCYTRLFEHAVDDTFQPIDPWTLFPIERTCLYAGCNKKLPPNENFSVCRECVKALNEYQAVVDILEKISKREHPFERINTHDHRRMRRTFHSAAILLGDSWKLRTDPTKMYTVV